MFDDNANIVGHKVGVAADVTFSALSVGDTCSFGVFHFILYSDTI